MPLGAFRLNSLGKFAVTAAAEVIRSKKSVIAVGNAQIDTAQSKFGGASALFDGTGDYLSISYNSQLRFGTGNFTFECWFRPTAKTQSYPLLMSNIDAFTTGAWVLHERHDSFSTKITFWVYSYNTGSPMLTSTTTISNGTFYHVAIVRNGNVFKMYVNGTEEASVTSSVNLDSGNTTSASTVSGSGLGSYNGHIEEIRWSKSARYTANFTPATTPFVNDENTVLLIHADGTDATTYFEDDNGTVRAPIGLAAAGNAQVSTAQSKFGGSSLLLDGVGDYVLATNHGTLALGSGNFTIEMWVRFTSQPIAGSYRVFYDARPVSTNGAYPVLTQKGTAIVYYANSADRITSGALTTGVWYHVAVSRSGTDTKMFIDGTQAGSTYTDSTTYLSSNPYIGGDSFSNTSQYAGYLDELRISSTARYTANFTAPTAPFQNDSNTLLLMHMDGTDATTIFRDDNGVRIPKAIRRLSNGSISTSQSKFGGASLDLTGTTNTTALRGAYSSDLSVGTGDFTIETWVRFTGTEPTGPFNQIFGQWANPYVTLFYITGTIGSGSGQQMILQLNNAVTSNTNIITGLFTTNVWYHIAVTRSSGTIRFFKDGTQVTTVGNPTNTQSLTGVSDFGIGYNVGADTQKLVGYLDELRVSNSARYVANFTPPTEPFQNDSNTLLLLHMDGTNGSTVFIDDNGKTPT